MHESTGGSTGGWGMPEPADIALRPMQPRDHASVLEINAANVEFLAPMDEQRLIYLLDLADRADVIDLRGEIAGFVITMTPGTDYDSGNYGWFAHAFGDDFYYIDRVVVDQRFRRRGVARYAYDELERAAHSYHRLTCEVSIDPVNEPSLRFHRGRGFVEMGQRDDGFKVVSLLSRSVDDRA